MKVENEPPNGILSPSSKFKRPNPSTQQDSKLKKNGVDEEYTPRFSYKFKDKNVKLTSDRMTATGHKGWTSVFSTHCASSGKWYYEVKINCDYKNLKFVGHDASIKQTIKGHVRVGYSCRYQRYDMPVGVNTYGFSVSDVDGKAFYDRVKHPYAVPFSTGDVIGCYISLEKPTTDFYDPRGDLKLYEFLRDGMLCDPTNIPQSNSNPDSYAQFSINGQMYPRLDFKIYDGYYHPAVSLYMGACVTINLGRPPDHQPFLGPDFQYKPPDEYLPCCLMDKPLIT
ncbi:hypothetical protein MACJ_002129 [Theileria orientalis]|uniref:B30.2/SPRY domain-containing protein n=1 Tax=Theileria orientalis TaxID=68886 RepID=A0A976M5L7_THEOR|nr:hypothetical protein MACJ_002129 [Theileria orientalis]